MLTALRGLRADLTMLRELNAIVRERQKQICCEARDLGMSFYRIAQISGLSEGHVHQTVSKARREAT